MSPSVLAYLYLTLGFALYVLNLVSPCSHNQFDFVLWHLDLLVR